MDNITNKEIVLGLIAVATVWLIIDFTLEMMESGCSYSDPLQIGFQDPATPIAEGIIDIHHHIMFFLTGIFIFVCWILFRTVNIFNDGQFYKKTDWGRDLELNPTKFEILKDVGRLKLTHNTIVEIVWTILPTVILYLIAVPSFLLLYSMDEIIDPALTIKAIGHQWYWSYQYSDYFNDGFEDLDFDSYMLPEDELELGQLRLLEVDNPIVLPVYTHIRILVTASDVLHCWAVPSLGVKVDAVPGRLNQASMFIKRLGTFYGQCSELCGVNHGFMPITVHAVTQKSFINWISLSSN